MNVDNRLAYEQAKKRGIRDFNSKKFSGQNPYIPSLDLILATETIVSEMQLGRFEIPISKVKGTKTNGRTSSFASNFMPILKINSEFASKWISLCEAHITEGIREPIKVYEYLNWFYVEEGNKRVSVLKYYEAVLISADVTRLIPKYNENDETIVIYYEFLNFYKQTKINYVWISKREGFNKLLKQMKKYNWVNKEDDSEFSAFYYRFRRVYHAIGGANLENTTGDAFLKYLEVYNYDVKTTKDKLKKELNNMWNEFKLLNEQKISLEFSTESLEKKSFLDGLTGVSSKKKTKIAFVNSKSPEDSGWTYGHEIGRNHLDNVFGDAIITKAFNHVPEDETAYNHLVKVVEEGFDIIFTTSPPFINPTLKAAVEFKNVKFFNCSENMSYKRVRTYFGRIYEPNFLVGMIAGVMTKTNNLGYVVTYPIPEVISSINAFTLGARFVNPDAVVFVKWVSNYKTDCKDECYNIDKQLIDMEVDIISHQESVDLTTKLKTAGIYFASKDTDYKNLEYLATPVWNWGEFYEKMVRNILNGSYNRISNVLGQSDKAINYWWGMETEVVDVFYSKSALPRETIQSIKFMKDMIMQGSYHPFRGPLYDNKGNIKLEEGHNLEPSDILTMDWFVEGVLGSIPSINVLEINHPLLELLSVKKKY